MDQRVSERPGEPVMRADTRPPIRRPDPANGARECTLRRPVPREPGEARSALTHRLICAFSVSSTTRSNDDAFGGAFTRCSATYLSRLATSVASLSFSALRWLIRLLIT